MFLRTLGSLFGVGSAAGGKLAGGVSKMTPALGIGDGGYGAAEGSARGDWRSLPVSGKMPVGGGVPLDAGPALNNPPAPEPLPEGAAPTFGPGDFREAPPQFDARLHGGGLPAPTSAYGAPSSPVVTPPGVPGANGRPVAGLSMPHPQTLGTLFWPGYGWGGWWGGAPPRYANNMPGQLPMGRSSASGSVPFQQTGGWGGRY